MPHVILVHGVGQAQQSADTLESAWIPALAGGIRTAGYADLADRLTNRAALRGVEVRMAFYGNHFLDPDAQGPVGGVIQGRFLQSGDYPTAAAISLVLMVVITAAVLVYARFLGTDDLV